MIFQQALSRYCKAEQLDEDNQYKCSKCHQFSQVRSLCSVSCIRVLRLLIHDGSLRHYTCTLTLRSFPRRTFFLQQAIKRLRIERVPNVLTIQVHHWQENIVLNIHAFTYILVRNEQRIEYCLSSLYFMAFQLESFRLNIFCDLFHEKNTIH